jgi:hypothetical protein
MKQFQRFRIFLAFFLLLACSMPCVSAFTVSSFTRDPPGYQAPGSPVTVDFAIDFSPQDSVTFPSSGELQMNTDLIGARWVPVLVLDGVETQLGPENGGSLVISGWYLSYPSTQHMQVLVKLSGNVPADLSRTHDLVRIQELDLTYRVVASARVELSQDPGMTLSTPTKKPVIKPTTMKIFTPYPADTPTPESPAGIETGIIATVGAALLLIKRK